MTSTEESLRQILASSFAIKMEKLLGEGIEAAFEKLGETVKEKLKPTGSSIATNIKFFQQEMGDVAFNAVAQNPKLLDMVNQWVSERKVHNGNVMIEALMSVIPEEHRHEVDRNDVASFLIVNWPDVEIGK